MKRLAIQATMTAVLAILSGCATHNLQMGESGAGWVKWKRSDGGNDHLYKAVAVTNRITWTEADKLARADGGYLATITSAEENTFIVTLMNNPKFFVADRYVGGHGFGPAIGGFQLDGSKEPDGGWCWVSGEPWNFSNWLPRQPDNAWGGKEDRVHFVSDAPGKVGATWNDLGRSAKVGAYVVERDN